MTTLYFRDGSEFTGTPTTFDAAKGAGTVVQPRACSRCGGTPMVTHPNWAHHNNGRCFDCNGTGINGTTKAKVYTAERLAKINATAAKRNAKRAAARAAAAAVAQAEADAKRDAFEAEHGALLAEAKEYAGRNDFIADVLAKGVARAEFTEKQAAALRAAVDRIRGADAMRAASRHIGTIGERIAVDGIIERVYTADGFGYGGMPALFHFVTIRTDAGAVVYKGSNPPSVEKGARVTFRATVKEHGEYKGEAQTIITRPSNIEVIEAGE